MRSPEVDPAGTYLAAGQEAEGVHRALDVNRQVVLLASDSATQADRNSDDQLSASARALQVVVTTANKAGSTATYTPKLQRKNADGTYADVWEAASPITAEGTVIYELGHLGDVTGASGVTERVALVLPRTWRFVLVAASADGSNNMDTYAEADVLV